MICTFHSSERKAGRTMALANVAELFRRRGRRVIAVDGDFEAPGLDRLFADDASVFAGQPGLIDLFADYMAEMSRPIAAAGDDLALPTDALERYITGIEGGPDPAGSALSLMLAGRRDPDDHQQFDQRVAAFDWEEFSRDWEGDRYLQRLRDSLMQRADLVLVDASAGLSPWSRLCLSLLSDVVTLFCPVGAKSLEQTRRLAQHLANPQLLERRNGRPLDMLVVPARIEYEEAELLNRFKQQFLNTFASFVPSALNAGEDGFWKLKIQNIPYFAYRDSIVVARGAEAIAEPLIEAYERLAAAIDTLRTGRAAQAPASDPSPAAEPLASADVAPFQTLRARKTDTAKVFISYARDDEAPVQELYESLEGAGFKPWLDKKSLLGGEDWQAVVQREIETSDFVVICLSSRGVVKKGYVQAELRKTLEVVNLLPEDTIYLVPVRLDPCDIPRSVQKYNCIDLFEPGGREKLLESIRQGWRRARTRGA
jgi:cellulose biosynthesis protein BcsQ